jgi:hypothetical protein
MNYVHKREDSTHISQRGMQISVQTFDPTGSDASVLVRASLHTDGPWLSVNCGFDLTEDNAIHLAEALMRHAGQLRAARKGTTVNQLASEEL